MKTLTKSNCEIRPYQVTLEASCVEELLQTKNKIVLLASEVGSGKTNMAINIVAEVLRLNPTWKVLISAHNRKDIRNQFKRRLFSILKEKNLSFVESDVCVVENKSDYNPNARVVLGIPSTLRKLPLVKYQLLLIDESHHQTEGKMVRSITKQIGRNGLKQLYLTATPDKFIDKKGVKIFGFSAIDLIREGRKDGKVYTVLPTTEVAEAYKDITKADYSETTWETLKCAEAKLPKEETKRIVEVILQRLAQTRYWPSLGNFLGKQKLPFLPIGKTLVFANGITHAEDLYEEFNFHYPGSVLLSTSENDDTSNNLDVFSNPEHPDYLKYNFLVVVDRATLAWDFPGLDNCVDISLGLNPSAQKQKYGRLMRPEGGKTKFFLKITTPDRRHQTDIVMQVMFWLLTPEGLTNYKGLGSIRNRNIIFTKTDIKKSKGKKNKKVPTSPVVRFIDPMDYFKAMQLDVFDDVKQFGNRPIETYHKASPNEILEALEGISYQDPEGNKADIIRWIEEHVEG